MQFNPFLFAIASAVAIAVLPVNVEAQWSMHDPNWRAQATPGSSGGKRICSRRPTMEVGRAVLLTGILEGDQDNRIAVRTLSIEVIKDSTGEVVSRLQEISTVNIFSVSQAPSGYLRVGETAWVPAAYWTAC